MDANVVKQDVEMTYESVKSLAGWMVDKSIVLTMTSYYVTSDRKFEAESLNSAIDGIKKRAGWLSPLRGNLLPMMGAFLDRPYTNIDVEVERLFTKQRALRAIGFRNTIHSYLAALLMTDDEDNYAEEARQAKKLYDEMKKQHFFLTSDEDYAYAVLLSKRGANPVTHAKVMRTYYDALRAEGFRSGNELQWLSQVMTYVNTSFEEALIVRAKEIFTYLQREVKVRPIHYPMIGFLAVFEVDHQKLIDIIDLTHTLANSKLFKWNRDMALSMGIGYVMHELTESEEANISLATSVELILQAQQAILVATIAAFAVTSSANSSTST